MSEFKWREINKREWWNMENKKMRVIMLAGSAVGGWLLLNYEIPDYLLSHAYDDEDGNIPFLFAQLIVTIPTILLLWIFRTYDARQAIAKADAQIQQGNLVSGLNKLIQDDVFAIEVGTKILLDVSKKTDEFDDQIRLAFIKRLQLLPSAIKPHLPNDKRNKFRDKLHHLTRYRCVNTDNCISINDTQISYTHHIVEWLHSLRDHPNQHLNETIHLIDMSFFYMEISVNHNLEEGSCLQQTTSPTYSVSFSPDELRHSLDWE